MRPSNNPDVVGVLDTLQECKVVLDAIDDPNFQQPDTDTSIEALTSSTGFRFLKKTMRLPREGNIDNFTERQFIPDPEFAIEAQDVDFIKSAAERILNQKNILDRVINRATKRTKAAKTILKFFESDIS